MRSWSIASRHFFSSIDLLDYSRILPIKKRWSASFIHVGHPFFFVCTWQTLSRLHLSPARISPNPIPTPTPPQIPLSPPLFPLYIEACVCRPDVDGIVPLRLKHHLTELWHMLSDPNGHQTSPHYLNTIDKSSGGYLIIPFCVMFYITLINDVIWWNQSQMLWIPWTKAHVFSVHSMPVFANMHRITNLEHLVSHYFNLFAYWNTWKSHDVSVIILQPHMAHSSIPVKTESVYSVISAMPMARAQVGLFNFPVSYFRIMFFHAPPITGFRSVILNRAWGRLSCFCCQWSFCDMPPLHKKKSYLPFEWHFGL